MRAQTKNCNNTNDIVDNDDDDDDEDIDFKLRFW